MWLAIQCLYYYYYYYYYYHYYYYDMLWHGLYPLPTKCLEVATCNQETIKIGFHPIAVNNYVVRV